MEQPLYTEIMHSGWLTLDDLQHPIILLSSEEKNYSSLKFVYEIGSWSLILNSVTRSGDILDFVQLFKAFGNNYFAQISQPS